MAAAAVMVRARLFNRAFMISVDVVDDQNIDFFGIDVYTNANQCDYTRNIEKRQTAPHEVAIYSEVS